MEKICNIGIIGAGAIGVLYASQLQEKLGKDHLFFIADDKRAARYQKEGLFCNGQACDFSFNPAHQKADLLIFSVKFTGMDEALEAVKPYVKEDTILLSMLNGIESEAVIGEALGETHLLYCVVQGMDATKQDNNVQYQNKGTVVFGDRENRETADVCVVKEVFDSAGIDYLVPEDIMHRLWTKLMLNCGVNQVSAVFCANYGDIQKPGRVRNMVVDTMREVQGIAAREGVNISDAEIAEWMGVVGGLSPEGYPSMGQDVMAKRPTELELFSGTIRKLGEKHQIPTPLNDYLYEEIVAIEEGY